jgi:hypothetical protein
LNIRIRTASDDRFNFAEITVIDFSQQSVDEAGRPRLKSNDFHDAQPLLEQKDAWRVFFVTLTCKIQKVKWSRERSPSPHRGRGVIASEPRKCCAGDAPDAKANSRETWPVQTMSPPFHSVV